MRTIRKYLLREILGLFALSLFIISLLFLSQRIIQLTEWAINRGVGMAQMMSLLVYLLPSVLVMIIPMVALFSILLGVGRLSSDHEVVALRGAGVSLYQLARPVFLFALFAAFLAFFCAQFLSPRAARGSQQVRYRIMCTKTEAAVQERLFVPLLNQVSIYVGEKKSDGELRGILLAMEDWPEEESDWRLRRFIFARSGRFVHDPVKLANELWLFEGTLIQEDRQAQRDDFVSFSTFRLRLDLGRLRVSAEDRRAEREALELKEEIDRLQSASSLGLEEKKELLFLRLLWHERLAIPFSCLALCFWALPLGIQPPRAGRARAIIVAVVLAAGFYYLMVLAKFAAIHSRLSPGVAMWLPNLLILLSGLYMLRQKNLERPIFILSAAEELIYYLGDRLRGRFR